MAREGNISSLRMLAADLIIGNLKVLKVRRCSSGVQRFLMASHSAVRVLTGRWCYDEPPKLNQLLPFPDSYHRRLLSKKCRQRNFIPSFGGFDFMFSRHPSATFHDVAEPIQRNGAWQVNMREGSSAHRSFPSLTRITSDCLSHWLLSVLGRRPTQNPDK